MQYFDFMQFSRDVLKFAERMGYKDGPGTRDSHTLLTQIADAASLDRQTANSALMGRPCSLKTICRLADFADLSLDNYLIREFVQQH